MANRKYRHNANEVRTSVTVNGDLNGYEDLFMVQFPASDDEEGNFAGFDIFDLFGDVAPTTGHAFNYEIRSDRGLKKAYKANGVEIDSIFDAIDDTAVSTARMRQISYTSSQVRDGETITMYINGQFGSLYFYDDVTNVPRHGGSSFYSNGDLFDNDPVVIKQWGKKNIIQSFERFGKAQNGNQFQIHAIDEPRFAEGCSLNRAFEDTTNNVFSAEALKSVNSWDSNVMGNSARVFENGSDQPNMDSWSHSGGGTSYAYYMRNNMDSITNGGKNMVPKTIAGWAGYADVSFSDSFQGATGIHNWDNLNTSQCTDMQYLAWKNTRVKSLGTMRNLETTKVTNFTAMFGYCGVDSYGAEGELLVDPSNWNMKSATTLFYMMAQEELGNGGNWSGELNWKTMKNVIDLHSVLKNRTSYAGARLDEFAPYSGNVVLFRSAFAGTAINHDFSNWDFSGVDATRTDVVYNENNSSGIMGGFVRDCENMSLENTVRLLEALDRPFGQGGLPVSGVDAQIGTASQEIQFGTSYQTRFDNGEFPFPTIISRGTFFIQSLAAKGYNVTGLDFMTHSE